MLIAVKKLIDIKSVVHRTNWQSESVEDIWITVKYGKQEYHFCCVYLLNNLNIDFYVNFLKQIDNVCVLNPMDTVTVAGDFNLPNLINSNGQLVSYNDKSEKLINTLHFCDLSQKSSVFNYSGVILDLVLSNASLIIKEVCSEDLLVPIDHHHPALNFQLDVCPEYRLNSSNVSQFNFWTADYNVINEQLISVNWSDILCSSDVNVIC